MSKYTEFANTKCLRKKHPSDQFFLENIFYHLPGLIYWKNKNSQYIGFNKNVVDLSGLSREELKGKTDAELNWGKKEAKSFQEGDQYVMNTGEIIVTEDEIPIKRPNGNFMILRTEKSRLYDQYGNVAGVLGVAMDITERKLAEMREKAALADAAAANIRAQSQEELRQKTMVMAGSIAHELRTPFAATRAGISVIDDCLPALIKTYELAKQANLDVPMIFPNQLALFKNTLHYMKAEINNANSIIDTLLMNVKHQDINQDDFKVCSIIHCVDEALARYPFYEEDKKLLNFKNEYNFNFRGNELLTIHILFNLIKNALYYIKEAHKGKIQIWLSETDEWNYLYFKDTGKGIGADVLPHIFDPFYSATYHGYGLGLAFCKMVMQSYGGNINCESVENEYTMFVLNFPKI